MKQVSVFGNLHRDAKRTMTGRVQELGRKTASSQEKEIRPALYCTTTELLQQLREQGEFLISKSSSNPFGEVDKRLYLTLQNQKEVQAITHCQKTDTKRISTEATLRLNPSKVLTMQNYSLPYWSYDLISNKINKREKENRDTETNTERESGRGGRREREKKRERYRDTEKQKQTEKREREKETKHTQKFDIFENMSS